MNNLASIWPIALAAVLTLAAIILVLLIVLLRKSAKASKYPDPNEAKQPETKAPATSIEEPHVGSALRPVFRRATRLMNKTAHGSAHDVPFFLLVGAEGSRDAEMLASSGMDMPFGRAGEAGVSLGRGRGFWFFDRGVILDLAGDMILSADGNSSDDTNYGRVLRLLDKLRPKRPVDGVIVTLSCAELLEASTNELARFDLASRTGRICRKIVQAQKELGLRLPIYILIAGCEQLKGFTALAGGIPPLAKRQILGWSNPYSIDTAFRTPWVDEAVTALCERIQQLQMEIFAEGTREAGALLRLDESVASLSDPLRESLDPLFKETAYHDSLMLRGIYLCGYDTATGSEDSVVRAGATAFVEDVLERKVFPEWGIASPSTWTMVSRNRAIRIAQGVAAGAAVLFTASLLWGYFQLRHDNATLRPFLQNVVENVQTERTLAHDQLKDEDMQRWATDLLDGMARIDFAHYGSFAIPSSWFSRFDDRLNGAVRSAFNEVILEAVRNELNEKGRRILDGSFGVRTAASIDSITVAAGFSPDQTQEYAELSRLVSSFRELESMGDVFNSLGRSGNLKDLGAVVKFAWGKDLPADFYRRGDLYRRALLHAEYEPFRPEDFRDDANRRAATLSVALLDGIFERNAFNTHLNELSGALAQAAYQWPAAGETARFTDLVTRIRDIESAVSGPHLRWAFQPRFSLGPELDTMTKEMGKTRVFGPEAVAGMRADAERAWSEYQRRLATISSPLTGPILAVRNNHPVGELSAGTQLLKSALETFLGQSFVATPPRNERVQVQPGARLSWTPDKLEQAIGFGKAYDVFRDKTLANFPADLRLSIDQVARDRARAQMVDSLAEAQQYEAVAPARTIDVLEEQVRTDVARFEASVKQINEALGGLSGLQRAEDGRDVASAMSAEAARVLRNVTRLREWERPYGTSQTVFDSWNGDAPPTLGTPAGCDAACMTVYLNSTRERVAYLAHTYAQPLLTWLQHDGQREESDVGMLITEWQGTLDDLRDYEAKKPGNTVAVLEDYIATQMPKVAPTNCATARMPKIDRPRPSVFAESLHDVSRQLSARCNLVAEATFAKTYLSLAQYFNDRLAGRYPFAVNPPKPGELEADLSDVRGFFTLFGKNEATLDALSEAASDPQFAAARRFITDIALVRNFLSPYLDKPEEGLSYVVEPEFRILRDWEQHGDQIIGWSIEIGDDVVTRTTEKPKKLWTAGEMVRLSLRWAADAPRVPVLDTAELGATLHDRTITYEYKNRWSLITALAEHEALETDVPSHEKIKPGTLALSVLTQIAGNEKADLQRSRVFMRVSLLDPRDSKPLTVPSFPSIAPHLETRTAERTP